MDWNKHLKHFVYGAAASALLLFLYFAIVGLLQGMDYAVTRFMELWYFMVPLVIGFGVQVGLYSCIHDAAKVGGKAAVASGGMSTGSMIACCAHHITDVAPLIGASALGIFLVDYQSAFLVIGLVSNALGILFILRAAKMSRVRFQTKLFRNLMKLDYNKLIKIAAVAGVIIIALSFVLIKPPQIINNTDNAINLGPVSDDQNSVTFEVEPQPFALNEPIKFSISMDTHSVALDFDPAQISTLIVDGKEVKATSWDGPGPGGHHRSGTLTFPSISGRPKKIRLEMRGAAGADRIFEWSL